MKLYLLTQRQNTGYDTFDSMVVSAPDEGTAVAINPFGETYGECDNWAHSGSWANYPDAVACTYLGEAAEGTKTDVIISSFNAG